MKKTELFCTLGPKSLNKKFLRFAVGKVSLLRLNMSHVKIGKLQKTIKFIRRYSSTPICIDTEGNQIRTKVKSTIKLKKNFIGKINRTGGIFNLYPNSVFDQVKINDILEIGFDNLKIKIIKKKNNLIKFKTLVSGNLENNKGVHLANRNISLKYLTEKDFKAINIAKKLKIKNFALSFTNTHEDIKKFNSILPNSRKIFKVETSLAIKNLNKLFKYGKNFLIDRGDLSKDITLEKIPYFQRFIFKKAKKFKKVKIFIATNFLESMIEKPYPTRAEANDIFSSLEMGASGLVLAAETAIGKYPAESVAFIRDMYSTFRKFRNNKL